MDLIILSLTKIISLILTKLNRGGSLPGKIALKLNKNILSKFKLPANIIFVTATNGKTTTTNYIAEVIKKNGHTLCSNAKGDNILNGITTVLIKNCNLKFEIKKEFLVLEVDELTVSRLFPFFKPTVLVIGNFFRDQLDRAGEMETIINRFEKVLENYDQTLILNSDDPNVLRLKEKTKAHVITYGVDRYLESKLSSNEASEGKFCYKCLSRLEYDYYQYSHIGKYHCVNNDFSNYEVDNLITDVSDDCSSFIFDQHLFQVKNNTIYTIYNCAAVLSVCKFLNIDYEKANDVFNNFELKIGRNEFFKLTNESNCILNLIKNPTGANEVIKYVNKDKKEKTVLIVLNDNIADGTDVSWIWDAKFNLLINEEVTKIICTGQRCYDLALRFKYEDLALDKLMVIENYEHAIDELKKSSNNYILATYTALLPVRKYLLKVSI